MICSPFVPHVLVQSNNVLFFLAQLEGVNEQVVLQVFVGNDAGRVKPHGFYQACRVTGRNTTACKEIDIDGTTVIEVTLDPSNKMTLAYVQFLHFNLVVSVMNITLIKIESLHVQVQKALLRINIAFLHLVVLLIVQTNYFVKVLIATHEHVNASPPCGKQLTN